MAVLAAALAALLCIGAASGQIDAPVVNVDPMTVPVNCLLPYEEQAWYDLGIPVYKRTGLPRDAVKSLCSSREASATGSDCSKIADWYERAMNHKFLLPEKSVERAAANVGDRRRLQAFMHKLLAGENVTAIALGGSIMEGAGTQDVEHGFMQQVFKWLRDVFPDSQLDLRNEAVGSATSFFYSGCLVSELVPLGSDLVFLDFMVNDKQTIAQDQSRSQHEMIIRTLLERNNSDGPPAVLPLHFFSFYTTPSFLDTQEDYLLPLLKYYGLPVLSLRDAVWEQFRQLEPGFRYDEIWCDIVHPSRLGHAYYADMVIGLLQDMLLEELIDGSAGSEQQPLSDASAELPPPLSPAGDLQQMQASECVAGWDLQAAALDHDGWAWKDGAWSGGVWTGSSAGGPLPGYESDAVGAALDLVVSTACRDMDPSQSVVLGVGNLKSMNATGAATVECVSGCWCTPLALDATWGAPATQVHHDQLTVSQADECVLRVTNSAATASGSTTFRVTGLMLRCSDQTFRPYG